MTTAPSVHDATTRLRRALSVGARPLWPMAAAAVRAGADVNTRLRMTGAPTFKGSTPLMRAARHGHEPLATLLLARGADPNARDDDGRTALVWASSTGNLDIVRALTGQGADLDASDANGWCPVMAAAEKGHVAVLEWLLDHGAALAVKDQEGHTALMYAIRVHQTRTAIILLDRGADPNEAEEGYSLLMQAAENDDSAIVAALLEKGAHPDARDRNGYTALTYAARYGHIETAASLLDHGANPNVRDAKRMTALSHVSLMMSEPDPKMIGLLVERGADCSMAPALPMIFVRTGRASLLPALDEALAHPAQAMARRDVLDRLTPSQRLRWLPRSHAMDTTVRTHAGWQRTHARTGGPP